MQQRVVAAGACAMVIAMTILVSAQAPGSGGSGARSTDGQTCVALKTAGGLPNATTVITAADPRPAAGPRPAPNAFAPSTPALPEHCEVTGRLNERIGANGQRYAIAFRLRLPTAWNGRFVFQGGGGANGNVGNALGALQGSQTEVALGLGYAVVSQDSGHDNATNNDPARGGTLTFGHDPQARRDFGYSSYDQVTRVSKALIARFYGDAPVKSYYVGCSEGGREAMMVSQRFGDQFDGVLACAPGFRLPRAALAEAWDSQAFAAVARAANQVDPNGHPFLNKTFTDEDLLLVSNAVLSACDGLDGAADGLIQSFTGCTTAVVEPRLTAIACVGAKTDACLSADQIAALKKVYGGPRTSSGVAVYAPWAWDAGISGKVGSTYNQGWRSWKIGPYGAPANSAINLTLGANALPALFVTPPVPVVQANGGPAAFTLEFSIDRGAESIANTSGDFREAALEFMKADATNLTTFRSRGGKLIIAHGVSDPVFSILDTINWWNDLDKVNGGRAADFARVFAVPGMNHCAGGPATDQFNAFAALVDWVEKGVAPDRIIATARMTTPWPGRTRPLCAYPTQAQYTGSGSLEDAANFVCR
jgi:feruloyl esterase